MKRIQFKATPDTGAEVCVAGENFINVLSIDRSSLCKVSLKLESADGAQKLKVFGFIDCNILYANLFTKNRVYICSGVTELGTPG